MTTLFDAMLATAELVRATHRGAATGGTNATLVDTLLSFPDGWFKGGTVYFLSGANAGKSVEINAYEAVAHQISFTAQVGAVAAGDQYAATTPHFTRSDVKQAVRQALEELGAFTQVDDTLETAENEDAYDLPAGVSHLVRVMVAGNETEPYGFVARHDWRQIGAKLYLDAPTATAGLKMRLFHNTRHPGVDGDADVIDSSANRIRIAWTAAYYLWLQRSQVTSNDEPATKQALEEARMMKEVMAQRFPVQKMPKDVRWGGWV